MNLTVGRLGEVQMSEQSVSKPTARPWYSRPVFFVADLNRALEFYTGLLGFELTWREGDGTGTVCQVSRATCEIILSEDKERKSNARLFVSLTIEGIAELRDEIAARSIPYKDVWWGYDAIRIEDPDGNELLFPVSN